MVALLRLREYTKVKWPGIQFTMTKVLRQLHAGP